MDSSTRVGRDEVIRLTNRSGFLCVTSILCGYYGSYMRYMLRFLWNATRGHHLAPWRSPYLLWRIETYCGVKMQQIGLLEFWEFTWRERKNLWRFLKWTAEMERYVHPKLKSS
jgi:hypothetical protein